MDRMGMIDFQLNSNPTLIKFQNKEITDDEMRYICAIIQGPNIKKMTLENYQERFRGITNQGMLYISYIKWDKLTHINLENNNVGDKGCKHLTRTCTPNLENIILRGNNIGDAGLLHLSKGTWRKLTYLSTFSKIAEAGGVDVLYHLIRGNWESLHSLFIGGCNLREDQIKIVLLCQFIRLKQMGICIQYQMASQPWTVLSSIKSKFPKIKLKP